MASLFSVSPGYAVAVRESFSAPLLIGLTNWGDIASGAGFAAQRSIITGVGLDEQPAFQVRQSLNRFIYGVIFGNDPGTLTISGLAFTGVCQGNREEGGHVDTGFDRIYDYYKRHRISTRKRPVVVVIGGSSFGAFLVGCSLRINNPQAGIASFGLALQTIPERED